MQVSTEYKDPLCKLHMLQCNPYFHYSVVYRKRRTLIYLNSLKPIYSTRTILVFDPQLITHFDLFQLTTFTVINTSCFYCLYFFSILLEVSNLSHYVSLCFILMQIVRTNLKSALSIICACKYKFLLYVYKLSYRHQITNNL